MDRLAQTALSAIRQMQDNKFDLAHNLANVNVPGFRRDLPNEGNAGFLQELEKLSAKVLPLETDVRKFSNEPGAIQSTGLDTDIAVLNQGFFFIQPENGEVALSRRGDFGVNAQNELINGV
jgi:flagellar basal-body rod protein FlgF